MDGISGMTSALSSLSALETGSDTQVKVLKMAMDQAEQSVAPLLENLGVNLDVRA